MIFNCSRFFIGLFIWLTISIELASSQMQFNRNQDYLARQIAYHDSMFQLYPEATDITHGLVRALRSADQHARVVYHLNKWVDKNPKDSFSYLMLGDAYVELDQTSTALSVWDNLLRELPGDARLYQQISERCEAAGLLEDAVRYLELGRRHFDNKDIFVWESAILRMKLGDYFEAVEFFQISIENNSGRLTVVEDLISHACELDDGSLLEALVSLKEGQGSVTKARLVSTCALFSGSPIRGIDELVGIIDSEESEELLFQYASSCEKKRYIGAAIRAYGIYIDNFPETFRTFLALQRRAELQIVGGEFESGFSDLERLVDHFPDHGQVLSDAVKMMQKAFDKGIKTDRIIKILEDIAELPSRGAWTNSALRLLVDCYLADGRLSKAEYYIDLLSNNGSIAAVDAGFRRVELIYFQSACAIVISEAETLIGSGVDHPLANNVIDILLDCGEYGDEPMWDELVEAQLLERQRRSNEAKKIWKKVERHGSPKMREWAMWLQAQVYSEIDAMVAIQLYENLVDSFPDGPFVILSKLSLAKLYKESGDFAKALILCQDALVESPNDVRVPEIRLLISYLRKQLDNGVIN